MLSMNPWANCKRSVGDRLSIQRIRPSSSSSGEGMKTSSSGKSLGSTIPLIVLQTDHPNSMISPISARTTGNSFGIHAWNPGLAKSSRSPG